MGLHVVVGLERRGGLVDGVGQVRQHPPVHDVPLPGRRGRAAATKSPRFRDRNRPTFHSLTVNFRPVRTSFSLYRRSVPMRPRVAHSRSASAPYLAITSSGTYRL